MSQGEGIKVVYDAQVVRLILDRPKQLNALNDDVRKVIAATLNDLMERPDIRLLVLSGEGKAFCCLGPWLACLLILRWLVDCISTVVCDAFFIGLVVFWYVFVGWFGGLCFCFFGCWWLAS